MWNCNGAVLRSLLAALLFVAPPARGQQLRLQPLPASDTPAAGRSFAPRLVQAEPRTIMVLPAGAATAHYGFFCRQELKWDKKLPMPVRFRVGSMESCNYLEGKGR